MTRKEQIKKALLTSLESITPEIESNFDYGYGSAYMHAFHEGAEWADANPKTPFEVAKTIMGERDILEQKLAIAVEALGKVKSDGFNPWGPHTDAHYAVTEALAKISSLHSDKKGEDK